MADLNQLAELIKQESVFINQLETDISKVIVGQKKNGRTSFNGASYWGPRSS
jgi:hypothetical protein